MILPLELTNKILLKCSYRELSNWKEILNPYVEMKMYPNANEAIREGSLISLKYHLRNNNFIMKLNKNSLLRESVIYNRYDIFLFLIEEGANIYEKNGYFHESLLETACYNNCKDIVKYLVTKVDIHKGNNIALRIACLNGYIDIVKILVEHGANIRDFEDRALRWSCENGHFEVAEFLLDNGSPVNLQNNLKCTAVKGHLDIVKILVERGANVTQEVVDYAIKSKNNRLVQWLIEKTSLLPSGTGMGYCAENNDVKMMQLLLRKKVDIHIDDDIAFRWAALDGRTEILKYLYKRGANIHALNDWALFYATEKNHLKVVKFLIEKGCEVTQRLINFSKNKKMKKLLLIHYNKKSNNDDNSS